MVRSRCELLSVEGYPARVMGVTQQMVEKFEKAEQLLGVSVLMGNGKKTNGDGGEVAVGASVSRLDQARRRLRHSGDDGMIVAKMRTSGETVRNGSDVEETAFGKDFSSLRMPLAPVTMAIGLVKSRSISAEKPKVVSTAAVSQGPSSRSRALKEEEKGP